MRHTRLRAKQVVFASTCGLLLAVFIAAQAQLFASSPASPSADPQSSPGARPSPTPAPPAREDRTAASPGKRDLSRYEKAGTLSFNAGASKQERDSVLEQARGFLLRKWQARGLGQVILRRPDAHGRETLSAFYVEPDEGGRWCVVLETDGVAQRFGFVEEIEMPEDGPPIPGTPDDGTTPRTAGRALHLKESAKARSGLVF